MTGRDNHLRPSGSKGRSDPTAARGLHLLDRGLRRPIPQQDRRQVPFGAADELRDAEGHLRVAAVGLLPSRLFDGIGIRLPTICIRPGLPNKAASGFFSNILREPLVGREAVLPVPTTVRHWFASPRAAVGFLLHAATINLTPLGGRRNISLPGLSATVGEEIEALRRVAGDKAVALIRHEPDPVIGGIVANWAENFDTRRATALGFEPNVPSTTSSKRAWRTNSAL